MCCDSQLDCACGRHYDIERWAALPLFARFTNEPVHLLVEVRVCTKCERQITRLSDELGNRAL